jgi:hypothetical protein
MQRALEYTAIALLCTMPVLSHGQSFSNPFDSETHTQEQCGQAHFGKGHSQVCHDVIAQYKIVKRNENAKETCVRDVEQDECERARLGSLKK